MTLKRVAPARNAAELFATSCAAALAITATCPAHATVYTVANLNDSGPGSLRAAIAQANSDLTPPTVVLIPSSVSGTITLTSGELDIFQAMSVQGPGAGALSVSGAGSSRIFSVNTVSGVNVSLSGLRIADGHLSGANGAGLSASSANLTLTDCVFDNNDANALGGQGGAIYAGDDIYSSIPMSVTLTGVTVQNNRARNGGGIAIRSSGTLLIQSSVISGNRAESAGSYGGGGLFVHGGASAQIRSTRIVNNYAVASGGGAHFHFGTQSLSDSVVQGNTSRLGAGGGIAVYYGTLDMQRCTVIFNTAQTDGGGVQLKRSYTSAGGGIESSTIAGNLSKQGFGGGVNLFNDGQTPVNFGNVTIYGNSAPWGFGGGGGIYSRFGDSRNAPLGFGALTLQSCTIAGNVAYKGGGLVSNAFGNFVVLRDDLVANNVATTGADPHPDPDVEGTFDASYNLIMVAGDATLLGPPGSNITDTDPLLGLLAANGGPTATLLPAPGSPAIDAGDPDFVPPPSADQRGLPRVAGAHVDLGAVERQTPEDVIFRDSFELP